MRYSHYQPVYEAAGKGGGGGRDTTPGTALTYYDAAKQALALAHSVDQVKDIADKAVGIAAYARQAKDGDLIAHATEIRMRAERRLGEMMREQPKAKPPGGSKARPRKDRGIQSPDLPITLAEAGIDKDLAKKARKAASMSEERFEGKVATAKLKAENSATVSPRYPRGEFSGEMERGTPVQYIEAARLVMGVIDLDPYSAEVWQQNVKAGEFFSIKDGALKHRDALKQEWQGRVWMNPPYRQPDITEAINKLIAEISAGRVTEAIVLLPGSCDPEWFHLILAKCAAICFKVGRIRFLNPDGSEMDSPPLGSIFFYIGNRPQRFAEVFSQFGRVLPVNAPVLVQPEVQESTAADAKPAAAQPEPDAQGAKAKAPAKRGSCLKAARFERRSGRARLQKGRASDGKVYAPRREP